MDHNPAQGHPDPSTSQVRLLAGSYDEFWTLQGQLRSIVSLI